MEDPPQDPLLEPALEALSLESGSTQLYRTLDSEKKQIRVLVVEPGTGDDPLHCTLRHVSLMETPKPAYDTISYVWGDKAARGIAYLHGHLRKVPASAEAALRRMRHPIYMRILWIDAICINQADVDERSKQVAFMDEIFSNGSRNLIWLGEDDGSTGAVLSDVHRLVEDMRIETSDFKFAKRILYHNDGARRYSNRPLNVKIENLRAVGRFITSPWFTRLWIVQEAALASENICYRGDFECPLQDVLRAALWLSYYQYRLPGGLSEDMTWAVTLAGFTDKICGTYNLFRAPSAGLILLLSQLFIFFSEDPRDHVYATLGLIRRYTNFTEIPPALKPDYTTPVAHVFRNAAYLTIVPRGSIRALHLVFHRQEDHKDGWPTWVPRWHRKTNEEDGSLLKWRSYKASGREAQPLPLLECNDANILPVKGYGVDPIKNVTPVMPCLRGKYEYASEEFETNIVPAQTLSRQDTRNCTEAESDRAMCSALIASCNAQSLRISENECVELYQAFLQHITTLGFPPPLETLSRSSTEMERKASEYQMAMDFASYNRRFFTTDRGFLGIGPPSMRSGDIVTVLFGSNLPFVLRPVLDSGVASHELVGECYVHGIMDGESVERNRARGSEGGYFYLR